MPHLDKTTRFEITPNQFLRGCSTVELIELDLLLQSPEYQNKMRQKNSYELPSPEQTLMGHFKADAE